MFDSNSADDATQLADVLRINAAPLNNGSSSTRAEDFCRKYNIKRTIGDMRDIELEQMLTRKKAGTYTKGLFTRRNREIRLQRNRTIIRDANFARHSHVPGSVVEPIRRRSFCPEFVPCLSTGSTTICNWHRSRIISHYERFLIMIG